MPCCLVACISSVELLFSLVPAATVSTIYSSFVLLSSVQFTFIIPVVFDGIACVKCVIYFKSRNVFNQAIAWWGSVIRFNEWLRKLIVLCCCCQGWKLEADWCLWWKEFSNGTVQYSLLLTWHPKLDDHFHFQYDHNRQILCCRFNLLVLNNRGGVHVQYSATVLQYHTGILILQYCVQ